MKYFFTLISVLFLVSSCQKQAPLEPEATAAEQNMADMMGITVEELRNQTPEEHMQMMQEMMK